jgi:hypothetical protein
MRARLVRFDMKKKTIRLDDVDRERLRRLAEREGKSQAEIIRSALALYDEQKPDRNFALTGSCAGDGRSIADIPEEELMSGFGEPEQLDWKSPDARH